MKRKVYRYNKELKCMELVGEQRRGPNEINIFVDTSKMEGGSIIQNAIEAKYENSKPKFKYGGKTSP